jgi:hypothetical protein
MALKWVGNLLGGKSSHRTRCELAHAAPIVSDYLLRWKKHVQTLAERLRGIRPILEILPVEMITLALAALAGREAGRFESATKVTTTE